MLNRQNTKPDKALELLDVTIRCLPDNFDQIVERVANGEDANEAVKDLKFTYLISAESCCKEPD